MEFQTTPPSKPCSNISDIVSKVANACRFRSIGVFYTDDTPHHRHPLAEDTSDATEEEAESDGGEKIHPYPVEILPKTTPQCATKVDILKVFDTISDLKSAYVQLQKAHIPYDPEKIKSADELVVNQLEVLCKIKRAYKENQFKDANCIRVLENLLEKLKSLVKVKNSEILHLQQQLQDLDLKNSELVEELGLSVQVSSFSSFEEIFKEASKGIHDFAKPLIGLMRASGWDLDRAADSIEQSVVYSKRSHKKYAFEAYIARKMFSVMMSLKPFSFDGLLRLENPIDALIKDPNSIFAKFCRDKYLSVIHPMMEVSFFGNLDHRTLVSSGRHPRTPFYEAFVKMARWVWALRGIAASGENKAEMYGVKRGSKFSDVFMTSVEEIDGDVMISDEGHKIEFMVMPGFRIGETIIRSRVYVSSMRRSSHC